MSIVEPLLFPDPELLSDQDELLVSVVIPCLNEADNIERCVTWARTTLAEHGLSGEVVVADNDSEDASAALALAAGARVVHERRRGYGNAYMAGFGAARGRYIVMADADLTYDFGDIPRFVEQLEAGADLVMGDRMDGIQPGAMPWLHQYIGNPILSGTLNLFFRTGVRDAHCGMRAFRRDKLSALDLRTTGMEFASEMVIRAAKAGLDISQLPIDYHPRGGTSKLSSFRDGWRHLRFLLVHSPTHLFVIPGAAMFLLGAWSRSSASPARGLRPRVDAALDDRRLAAGHRRHPGARARPLRPRVWQLLHGRARAVVRPHARALQPRAWPARRRRRRRRRRADRRRHRPHLDPARLRLLSEERLLVAASALIIIGLQVLFSSFLLSILGLRRRDAVSTDVQVDGYLGQAPPLDAPIPPEMTRLRLSDVRGFAMIEAIAAATLLVVVALGVLRGLDVAQRSSGREKARSTAAALTEQDQERLRSFRAVDLANYERRRTISTVNKVKYTVESQVDWVRDSTGGTESCNNSTSQADYMRITSTTSSDLINTPIPPIKMSSLVAPPIGAFGTNQGTLGIQVNNAAGQGVDGPRRHHRRPDNQTNPTNSAGCAIFAYVPVGSTTRPRSTPPAGSTTAATRPPPSAPPSATARSTSRRSPTTRPRASTQTSTRRTRGGQTRASSRCRPPRSSPLELRRPHRPVLPVRRPALLRPAGRRGDVDHMPNVLFPFPDGYGLYGGGCRGADPTAYDSDYYTTSGRTRSSTSRPAGDAGGEGPPALDQPARALQRPPDGGDLPQLPRGSW